MIKCIGKTKIFTRPSFRESFLGMQSCAAPTTISLPCFVLVVARNETLDSIGSSARESDRRTGSHWCINNGSLNEHWFANNNNSEKNSGDTVQNYELILYT
jgi:hypothetical protein